MADDDTDTGSDVGLGDQSDAQDLAELAQFRQSAPGVYSPTPAPAPAPAAPQQALTPPTYQRPVPFDPKTFKPTEEPFSFTPTKPQENKSGWSDAKNELWSGVVSNYKDVMGAAKFASDQLNLDPSISSFIKGQQDWATDQATKSVDDLSPSAQQAMHASVLGYLGMRDAQGNAIPTPGEAGWKNYIGATVTSAIPALALAIIPGSILGKVAVKTAAALGAGEAATGAAAVAGQMAGSGGAYAVQNAGLVYDNMADAVRDAPDSTMMQNPHYAELRKSGMTEGEAKWQTFQKAAPAAVAWAAAVGGAAGAGIGGRLIPGGLGTMARVGVGAAEGAATMGAQSGVDTYLTQQATGQTDLSAVMADAISGGVQGAAFGAAGGVLHAKPGVDPDVGAAMLQIEGAPAPLQIEGAKEPQGPAPGPVSAGSPSDIPPLSDNQVRAQQTPSPGAPPVPNPNAVSFADVNTAPVTRAPEPVPAPPPAP